MNIGTQSDTGVSPVIGVVILVAIVVILSGLVFATTSVFTGTTTNAQAGASVDYQSESAMSVQLTENQNADTVLVKSAFGTEYELSEVGDSIRLLNAETNTTPTVIGVRDGERTVLQQVPPQSFEPDLVVGTEDDDYNSISDALADASNGDIIVLEKDEYETPGVTIDTEVTLVAESGTVIRDTQDDGSATVSVNSENTTVSNLEVDADGEPYGIQNTASDKARLAGVEVTNASTSKYEGDSYELVETQEFVPSASIESSDSGENSDTESVSETHTTAPDDLQVVLSNMSGSGTASDPYEVTNDHELQAMRADKSASYELVVNIDASGTSNWNNGNGFQSIGDWEAGTFKGSFDGNSYEVRGLTIDRDEKHQGLFGRTSGDIKNVGVVNVDIQAKSYAGAIAGHELGDTTIENTYATGSVTGAKQVGGLVGRQNNGAVIKQSYASVSVSGSSYVGGILGYQKQGSVSGGYWDTEVSGQTRTAGSGTGLTTSEMQGDSPKQTMSDFDFETTWNIIDSNYPELQITSDSE